MLALVLVSTCMGWFLGARAGARRDELTAMLDEAFSREDTATWLERLAGRIFFGVINRLLSPPIPANVVTARLMTARCLA